MKQPDVPLWRKSMLQHLNLDDILKTLYEIAENGDPFGYDCLTSVVQELDERAAIMDRRLKAAFAAKDEAEAKKLLNTLPGRAWVE